MNPVMLVIAGPPGSGKSTAFPVRDARVDFFNIDDRCAELNGGSYQRIPLSIRELAQAECEAFVLKHIEERCSFAVETSLRTDAAILQAQQAKAVGFLTMMRYIATDDVDENIQRVTRRGLAGGHSARPDVLRGSYRKSIANLAAALETFDIAEVYDNTVRGREPRLVLTVRHGAVEVHAHARWVAEALRGTRFEAPSTQKS